MRDEPGKFMCLADYWCSCVPVGKPVAESTMYRHRDRANDIRKAKGLPISGRGPRHSLAREHDEYEKRLHMGETENPNHRLFLPPALITPNSETAKSQGPLDRVEQTRLGCEILDGRDDERMERTNSTESMSQRGSNDDEMLNDDLVANEEEITFPLPHSFNHYSPLFHDFANEFQHPLGLQAVKLLTDEVSVHFSYAALAVYEQVPVYGAPGGYGDEEDVVEEEPLDHENVLQAYGVGHRSGAAVVFRDWAFQAWEWVQTFIEFGVTGKLMGRILKLIKAPLVPITLKRNLLRYSGLKTVKYLTCRGHMLIGRMEMCGVEHEVNCLVCEREGTRPDFVAFEYLPVLPRLKAWVGNEKSFHTLYSYHHAKLDERMGDPDTFGPGKYYEDVMDGELFRRIAGGFENLNSVRFDFFLAPSCDGLQTFGNKEYDCWLIVAINHNLSLEQRFLINNLLPLGFIKGPAEPVLLDTFFIPLVDEIKEINKDGGTALRFFDGKVERIRVQVPHITGDKPAVSKMSGTTGSNGKSPCLCCEVRGVWCPQSKHYYYPSKVFFPGTGGDIRRNTRVLYDIDNPKMRAEADVSPVLKLLRPDQGLSKRAYEELQRDSGIKSRTVLHDMPTIVPFTSFPLDTMHLIMNICKDITELLKGDNTKLKMRGYSQDAFVISEESWESIDAGISKIGKGTSLSSFGLAPRKSAKYKQWKAAECSYFYRYFALIVFEGHLPMMYLRGLRLFCRVIELCSWPALTNADVEQHRAAKEFVKHFEERYYRYQSDRICLCKSTLHTLVHLADTVRQCGPLLNCNQFWMERYVGVMKQRLNATILPAESLTENVKFQQSYNLFYGKHFSVSDEQGESDVDQSERHGIDEFIPLAPCDKESLADSFHRNMRTRRLLNHHLRHVEEMNAEEAEESLQCDTIWSFGRVRVPFQGGRLVVGACKSRRHRQNMARSDYYVSTRFDTSDDGSTQQVHYGRILKVLQYTFETRTWCSTRVLLLMDWADRLELNSLGQVFRSSTLVRCFSKATIEGPVVVGNPIGVLEHRSPAVRGLRTYFIDPAHEPLKILEDGEAGPDGVIRTSGGLR